MYVLGLCRAGHLLRFVVVFLCALVSEWLGPVDMYAYFGFGLLVSRLVRSDYFVLELFLLCFLLACLSACGWAEAYMFAYVVAPPFLCGRGPPTKKTDTISNTSWQT